MNAHSASWNAQITGGCSRSSSPPIRFASGYQIRRQICLRIARKDACAQNSASRLSREHVLVDLLRIAEHDETYVAHVFLRHALHVRRCYRAQLFQKHERVATARSEE